MRILFETNLQTKNNIVYFYGEDDIVLSELLKEMYINGKQIVITSDVKPT